MPLPWCEIPVWPPTQKQLRPACHIWPRTRRVQPNAHFAWAQLPASLQKPNNRVALRHPIHTLLDRLTRIDATVYYHRHERFHGINPAAGVSAADDLFGGF